MDALTFDPDRIDPPSGHFIGGTLRDTTKDDIEVLRPSDGKRLAWVPDAGEAIVDEAVTNALTAWRTSGWAKAPPRERARVLGRWADLIDADAVRLAQLEAACSTRPVTSAHGDDVPLSAEAIRFFAELADKLGGDVAATRRDSLGMIVSEPYGVVGAIAPWNVPLSMCSWKCGPALAAGNAVVLKPSELTPFSTLRMAQLAIEAGMPTGIFNVVNGRGPVAGAALVRHPDVAKVSFTGSTRTGAAIMAAIAQSGVKPVTLELGGKSPQLVFERVPDLGHVARCVVRGFTNNGGQGCVAGSRLIAHRKIVEPLLEAILELIADISPGLTWDSRSTYSPIINRPQALRVQSLVDQSRADGAELIAGGGLFDNMGDGCFYRPTVLGRVTGAMSVMREEVFGPVLTIQTFEEEAEGVAMAAHPVYGLAAGVHTSDLGQAMRAMRGIAAGTVWINRYSRSGDMIMSTGGFQQSGIGKDLGVQAMEASLRYKSVLMDF
jgi:aldehyde dehydrogenase (NAD+)